jgi:hypothetical protein
MKQETLKKQWQKPTMEVITLDELNKVVVSGACSTFGSACDVVRIGRFA